MSWVHIWTQTSMRSSMRMRDDKWVHFSSSSTHFIPVSTQFISAQYELISTQISSIHMISLSLRYEFKMSSCQLSLSSYWTHQCISLRLIWISTHSAWTQANMNWIHHEFSHYDIRLIWAFIELSFHFSNCYTLVIKCCYDHSDHLKWCPDLVDLNCGWYQYELWSVQYELIDSCWMSQHEFKMNSDIAWVESIWVQYELRSWMIWTSIWRFNDVVVEFDSFSFSYELLLIWIFYELMCEFILNSLIVDFVETSEHTWVFPDFHFGWCSSVMSWSCWFQIIMNSGWVSFDSYEFSFRILIMTSLNKVCLFIWWIRAI